MRKMLTLLVVGAVAVSASVASAAGPKFASFPTLQPAPPPAPAADGTTVYAMPDSLGAGPMHSGAPVQLFHCVRYKDLDNIAPCAVPMIVQVKDPCACHNPCSCCAPQCVNVQICVPPCGCAPRIKCSRGGDKVEYCFGEYAVEIRVKDGYVEVDYDD